MDDAFGVRCVQTARHLRSDRTHPRRLHRTFCDRLGQRRALQKLHHEVGMPVCEHAKVRDIDDVAVIDLGGRLGFLDEALHGCGILRGFLAQNLDRHRLVDQDMAGFVDHAHAAFA